VYLGHFKWLAILCLLGAAAARAADAPNPAAPVRLVKAEPWSPHPKAAPRCTRSDDGLAAIEGNGTRTCCGGWQFVFAGIEGGRAYRLHARVEHRGLESARDSLAAIAYWDEWKPDQVGSASKVWNYLLPHSASAGVMELDCIARAPQGAERLTIRYVFRWSQQGSSEWTVPAIEPAEMPPRSPVKICVVNAPKNMQGVEVRPFSDGLDLPEDAARSIDLWGSLILEACRRKPQLVITPEVVIGGKDSVDGALTVPGPATGPFEKIAREHQAHLVLGMRERDGDALYNSAVLIGPSGKVEGVYRKVHLAISEGLSGFARLAIGSARHCISQEMLASRRRNSASMSGSALSRANSCSSGSAGRSPSFRIGNRFHHRRAISSSDQPRTMSGRFRRTT
jgi:hypothetical protein